MENKEHEQSDSDEQRDLDDATSSDSLLSCVEGGSLGEGSEYRRYLRLCRALRDGNLEATKSFFATHPGAQLAEISPGKTTINLAIEYGQVDIIKWLLETTPSDALERKVKPQEITPLHVTVATKNIEVAKILVERNRRLLLIPDCWNRVPLAMAGLSRQVEMVHYFYKETPIDQLDHQTRATILNDCVIGEIYDVALDILQHYKDLAFTRDYTGQYVLNQLTEKPSAFHSGSSLEFWQRWIYACIHIEPRQEIMPYECRRKGLRGVPGIKHIYDEKLKHVQALEILRVATRTIVRNYDIESQLKQSLLEPLFKACHYGIVEFVVEIPECYPPALFAIDNDGKSIFHLATSQRHEKIFNLLYKMQAEKNKIIESPDRDGNNMLHLVAALAPASRLDCVSGAALQMQRELQWFKEVQAILPSYYMDEANVEDETPPQIFHEQHKELMINAENWMKGVAKSCTVVAALTVTIMFAVAFTLPGGYDEETGVPKFLDRKSLMAFIIADALSLFSSSTSVLVFLGILTSRYKENDFLMSLPRKLIFGLSSLFFSIVAMMITFCLALVITLQERMAWNSISIICGASIPVSVFALLQFPLLVRIAFSTFWPRIFDKPKNPFFKLSCLTS